MSQRDQILLKNSGRDLNVDTQTKPESVREEWIVRGRRVSKLRFYRNMSLVLACFTALLIGSWIISSRNQNGKETPAPGTEDKSSNSLQKAETTSVCDKYGCIEQAAFMMPLMNRSADPCTNFYQYACGGFNRNNPPGNRYSYTTADKIADQNSARIAELLDRQASNISATGKAKAFYQSCVRAKQRRQDFTKDLVELLTSYGGMPWDQSWNPEGWGITNLLHTALAHHSVETFYTIEKDPTSTQVRIQYPHLPSEVVSTGLFSSNYSTPEYQNTIIKTLKTIDKINKHDLFNASQIPQIAESIVKTDQKLMQTILKNGHPLLSLGPGEPFARSLMSSRQSDGLQVQTNKRQIIQMQELHELSPHMEWDHLLRWMFGDEAISNTTNITVPGRDYMKEMDILVSGMEPRELQTYIMWSVIREYLPILGPEYAGLKELTTGTSRSRLVDQENKADIKESCTKLLETYMLPAVGGMLLHEHIGLPHLQEAKKLIHLALSELKQNFEWMSEEDRRKILDEANFTVVFGSNQLGENLTTLNDYYQNVDISESNFFQNVVNLDKLAAYELITEHQTGNKRSKVPTHPVYIQHIAGNTLSIPFATLQVPYYNVDNPPSTNAGGLGHSLLKRILDRVLKYSKVLNKKSGETAEQLNHYADCFVQLNPNSPAHKPGKFPPLWRKFLSESAAINTAYRLYKSMEDSDTNETSSHQLPGLQHLTSDQMFFISLAQTQCSNKKDKNKKAKATQWPAIPNAEHFRQAFNCPAEQGIISIESCRREKSNKKNRDENTAP